MVTGCRIKKEDRALERVNLIALGIKENEKRHLFTAHCHPESSPVEEYRSGGWLDFNNTYTYDIVHRKLLRDYNRKPSSPFMLIESTYEGEHNASEVQIRRQAYWAILCGRFGHVFGNWSIWAFGWKAPPTMHRRLGTDWKSALDSPGATSMMHWGNLFKSIPWYNLIPDQRNEIVTEGMGEFMGLDYASAARTTERDTVVIYMPTKHKIKVDMTRINGKEAKSCWFDRALRNTTSRKPSQQPNP